MKHVLKWKAMQMILFLSFSTVPVCVLSPEKDLLVSTHRLMSGHVVNSSPSLALIFSVTTGEPINPSKCHPSTCKRLMVQLVCKPGVFHERHYMDAQRCCWTGGVVIFNYIFDWIGYRFCWLDVASSPWLQIKD